MIRLIALFILLTISVFGAGICDCEPGISGTITAGNAVTNILNIPGALTRTTLPGGAGYIMDLNITDPVFLIQLHVNTNPDPAIGFGLRISGDPIVDITITQVFMGGPYPNLFASGFGSLIDGINGTLGNGAASLKDSYIKTTVFGDGIPVTQQTDLNCAFAGQQANFSAGVPCASPSAELVLASQALNFTSSTGLLQVQIHFNLSDFDTVTMNGTSVISAAAVPEPATGALFGAGLLAFAGFAWRGTIRVGRNRKAA